MNREEFRKNLLDGLYILQTDVAMDECALYLKQIDEKIQSGLSEEEAIKSLGDISTIQKDILNKRGINPDKVIKKKGFFYKQFEELFQVIHRVVEQMANNSFKENVKIIVDIFVLIFIICIIKIPFILIQNLGDSVLLAFEYPILLDIWALILDVLYIIVAIMVFMNVFTKWFKNLKVQKKEKHVQKIEAKALESVNLKDESEENKQ